MLVSHQLMMAVMVVYRMVKVVEEEKGRHPSTMKRPVMNVCNHKNRVVKGGASVRCISKLYNMYIIDFPTTKIDNNYCSTCIISCIV